jgi:methyl halide transferase
MTYPSAYWNQKYDQKTNPGWDIGYPSPTFTDYIDQLTDKNIRILVIGAGFGHEVEYLYRKGFIKTYYLDFSAFAVNAFKHRVPDFPLSHILIEDFFEHLEKYDLILEQTFFCSIPRFQRWNYVKKVHELLYDNGKLVGLLFNYDFGKEHPPFGGSKEEYCLLFKSCFNFMYFETAYNSIKPRKGREFFINLIKKNCLCQKKTVL